jgi:hypothetical protein
VRRGEGMRWRGGRGGSPDPPEDGEGQSESGIATCHRSRMPHGTIDRLGRAERCKCCFCELVDQADTQPKWRQPGAAKWCVLREQVGLHGRRIQERQSEPGRGVERNHVVDHADPEPATPRMRIYRVCHV